MSAVSTESRVDLRAVIAEDSCDVVLRRAGDSGLYVMPSKLDGDGEFHLSIDALGEALRVLGINRADVFPDG